MDVEISELTCKRCGKTWIPRQKTVRVCPKCKTAYWDTVRTRKSQFKREK
jgi:Zn finger protein HypA/HybF involved in hydrogenase expression